MMVQSASPLMPSRDLESTADFYTSLGFEVVNPYEKERYLIVARDGVQFHFFDAMGRPPDQTGAGAYVRARDVSAFSAAIAQLNLPSTGIPKFAPAEDKPWGMRECAIVDPDGNLLRVGEDMDDIHG